MATTLVIDGARVLVTGRISCLVESRSRPGQFHAVEMQEELDEDPFLISCTCESGMARRDGSCWHARLVHRWLLGKARVEIEETEAVTHG